MDDNKIPSFLEDLSNYLCGIRNLSMNPQYLGLELMEFVLHNYNVDLKKKPYEYSKYTTFDYWIRQFSGIENVTTPSCVV